MSVNGHHDPGLEGQLIAEIDRLEVLRNETEEQLLRHRAALNALQTPTSIRTRPRASEEIRMAVLEVLTTSEEPLTRHELAALAQFEGVSDQTIGAALTWLSRTNQIRARSRGRNGQRWTA